MVEEEKKGGKKGGRKKKEGKIGGRRKEGRKEIGERRTEGINIFKGGKSRKRRKKKGGGGGRGNDMCLNHLNMCSKGLLHGKFKFLFSPPGILFSKLLKIF